MAVKTNQGSLLAQGRTFAIVVSRFNEFITAKLLSGALDGLTRHGAVEDAIEVTWVPGAFEVPLVAKTLAAAGRFDAVICLGAVIRGATPHFNLVAGEMAKGIAQAMLDTGVPVVFGVVTADTIEQAVERAGTKLGNKGFDAAVTAIEMANLMRALRPAPGSAPSRRR
ncbi:MAG: 6,7-dimethyl-8-ribityllumazine synthase [Candidatus Riflebacteria bacterium]|nr:6,7-dimethyl-8-ribityllumazine synthase [Candidatus Riflebacteria bacterium]